MFLGILFLIIFHLIKKFRFVEKVIPYEENEKLLGEKPHRFMNVYIKNFRDDLDDEKLEDLFKKYGKITSAKVMEDEMGKSKGFGFVNFEKYESAAKAVEDLDGKELNGKILYVTRAQKKSERDAERKKKSEALKMERINRYLGLNLCVKNLDIAIDDEKLLKEFSPYGLITSAKVMTDGNGLSRGFGFVFFSSPEEAAKAVTEMNGRIVASKALYVSLAQRKAQRMQGKDDERMQLGQMFCTGPSGYPMPPMPPAQRNYFLKMAQMGPPPRWPIPPPMRPRAPPAAALRAMHPAAFEARPTATPLQNCGMPTDTNTQPIKPAGTGGATGTYKYTSNKHKR